MSRKRPSAGFTLIEMIIAVTLVAAIITGLLMAMRTGLSAYQRVNQRLDDNRRVMGLDQALHRQLGGLMPVTTQCPGGPNNAAFSGDPVSLRFVSSSSLAEGARGYPRVVEYLATPDPHGGARLMMNERIYAGPSTLAAFCAPFPLPVQLTPQSVEMAGQMASIRFLYRKPIPDSPLGGDWVPAWQNIADLPRAIRIEMTPLASDPAHLPMPTISVPVHLSRQLLSVYTDER